MIDVEQEIFGIVASKVREQFPNIFITGEYLNSPPSFPCVYLIEEDNQVYRNTRTSSCGENHTQVIYEVTVYSNLKTGKKSQCRKILGVIDSQLAELGFTRTTLTPVPNASDATIYRLVARYRAIISKENVIYRR